jgi:hypothetical protein
MLSPSGDRCEEVHSPAGHLGFLQEGSCCTAIGMAYASDLTRLFHIIKPLFADLLLQTHCLTETFFPEALERARYLDSYLAREGKVVGPLHGLPISLKVSRHLYLLS